MATVMYLLYCSKVKSICILLYMIFADINLIFQGIIKETDKRDVLHIS